MASDPRPVPAGSEVTPEAGATASLVVEGASAVRIRAPFQALRRAPQNRRESAGELALEPLDARPSHRRVVDEVPAGRIGLELRANRQLAGDRVQLGQLSPGERPAGAEGVCEAIEQRAQLAEGLVAGAVVQEADECLVRIVRNDLL